MQRWYPFSLMAIIITLFPGCAAHWICTVGLLMLALPSSSSSALRLYIVKMSHILNLYLVISSRCLVKPSRYCWTHIEGYILISLQWEWRSFYLTHIHTEYFIILPNLVKQRLSSISINMRSYLSEIWVNNGRIFLLGMYACARKQSTIKIPTF